jgi:hypothetical protein
MEIIALAWLRSERNMRERIRGAGLDATCSLAHPAPLQFATSTRRRIPARLPTPPVL